MTEKRKKIWILPIIGGILGGIGLLAPTAVFFGVTTDYYYWIWGLVDSYSIFYSFHDFYVNVFVIEYLIPEMMTTFLLSVAIMVIIGKANLVRRGSKKIEDVKNYWVGMGIILIFTAIVYIVGMEIGTRLFEAAHGLATLGFWRTATSGVFQPYIGIITPFFGGGLTIGGALYGQHIVSKERISSQFIEKKIIPEIIEAEQVIEYISCIDCSEEFPKSMKFCPYCGVDQSKLSEI